MFDACRLAAQWALFLPAFPNKMQNSWSYRPFGSLVNVYPGAYNAMQILGGQNHGRCKRSWPIVQPNTKGAP